MDPLFAEALEAGRPEDLVERQRGEGSTPTVPTSAFARGLSLVSLTVIGRWDWLWRVLNRKQAIYFISIATDLSGDEPVVLPPKAVPADAVYKVPHGETVQFTLGDGVPIFTPRLLTGGLIVYLIVSEADEDIRHLGDTMAQVHEDLTKASLPEKIIKLVTNPSATIVDEVMAVASAAIQPVASVLKNNNDDAVGLFSGYYPANGSWDEKLESTRNSTTLILKELR